MTGSDREALALLFDRAAIADVLALYCERIDEYDIDGMATWHEHWDGTRCCVRLRYVDRLRRTPAGWLIGSRRVEAAGVEGMDGVAWTWVPRHPPVDP